MEYLQIFDENKIPLNEKVNRKEKNNLVGNKYFMVVLIFIENSEGKFLLQKTSKLKGSCMATTGGHVKYGESSIDTIIREFEEENGFRLNKDNIEYVDDVFDGCCIVDIYYAKYDIDISTVKVQEEEVESIGWYSIDEIKKFIEKDEFRKGNIDAFNKVLKYREKI